MEISSHTVITSLPGLPNGPVSHLILLQMMTHIFNQNQFISNMVDSNRHGTLSGEIGVKTELPKMSRRIRSTDESHFTNDEALRELVLENHRLKKEIFEKDEKIIGLKQAFHLQDCGSSSGKASRIEIEKNVTTKDENSEETDSVNKFSEFLNNISIINKTISSAMSDLKEEIYKMVNDSKTIMMYVDTIENRFNSQNELIHNLIQILGYDQFSVVNSTSQYSRKKCNCKRSLHDEHSTERKAIEEEKLSEELKGELESAKKYNELLYIYYKYEDKLTGLHRACLKCDLDDVKLLVKHGASMTKMDKSEFGNTAAHFAAINNCTSVMDWITQNSSLVNIQNKIGATPLHICAKFDNVQVAKLLIDRNANVVAKTLDERTPLHFAAQYGHSEMAELLLYNGADVKVLSQYYGAPIHTAARSGNLNIVRLLLDFGANINSTSKFGTPLHVVSQGGDHKVAEVLLQYGAAVNSFNEGIMTPLHVAAEYDKVKVAEILINNRADLEAKMENMFTPLHVAARNSSLQVAKLLIDSGAQIDAKSKDGLTPLYIAAECGNLVVGRLLLDRGASLSSLPYARFSKYLVDVLYAQELLDLPKEDKERLLIHATRFGNLTLARLLIEVGTYVSNSSDYGFTPLHWAATKGYTDLAVVLLDAGAVIEKTDWYEFTPLNRAAWNGNLEICKLLIHRGANLESHNMKHHTPLHGAAMEGYLDVVQLLVQHGANVKATDSFGRTALEEAIINRHFEVANWLRYFQGLNLSNDNKTVRNTSFEESLPRFVYDHI